MAVLLQPMTAENASGQLPDVQHSPENDEWSRPIGAPQLPNPGAAGSPNCVKGPGPIQTTGSFIYADGGAADLDGNVTCFSAVDSGWKTVTTQYGQFKMQTLAHKWPDGQWWVDNEGRTQLSYNTYEGFRRNSVNDDVDVAALEPISRVARSSAPAVVEVFGDRCFRSATDQVGTASASPASWTITQQPSTGFFVSANVVVTDVQAIRRLARDEELGHWGEAPFTANTMSCAEQEAYEDSWKLPGAPRSVWEEGRGPFVRLFDGRWAAGRVLAQNTDIAVIQLERVTSNGLTLVDTWETWSPASAPGDPLPLAPTGTVTGRVVAIHHPLEARENGGWFMTTGSVIECDYLSDRMPAKNTPFSRIALDLYSDRTSEGAPVLDAQGYVVGILDTFGVGEHPDVCKPDRYRGKNSLGILSEFLAAPADLANMIPVDVVRTFILGAVSGTAVEPAKTKPSWTLNPLVSSGARFEVMDWGQDFTVSGFPKSELTSDAFNIAAQATLMFMRETGCVLCTEEAERTGDFSVQCMCTGFAVTNYLIVTNDHCVPSLNLGSATTFRTAAGQDVEAELIGKTSIDGIGTDINGTMYDPFTRGDVALLRTRQRMDLTPVKLADSGQLRKFDPILSVGHPAIMARTGPYVTTAGHSLGLNAEYPQSNEYYLPAHKGASGSAVFNLAGEVVGQVAAGGPYYQGEAHTSLINVYSRRALTIMTESIFINLTPIPFEVSPYVPIGRGMATSGATSNYIRTMVEKWAPGELGASAAPPWRRGEIWESPTPQGRPDMLQGPLWPSSVVVVEAR